MPIHVYIEICLFAFNHVTNPISLKVNSICMRKLVKT